MYTFFMKYARSITPGNILIPFLLLMTLPVLMTSCKKGDTGPAGTANVIFSDWFTASPWVKDTVFNVYGFNYNKPAPDITQNVLDSGTVIVYGKLKGYNTLVWPTGTVAQMPILINYKFSSGGVMNTDTWSALATPGNLKIRFVNDQNYYGSIDNSHQFRYVIIPGGKKATAPNNYAHMSYEEVCQQLQIPQ
jgi:hypothetical protein